MLVFNEGVPRSGKSYDAVKSHILPALKAGRKVYARLNGLDHDKIADYLGMNVEIVRDLLVLVSSAQVRSLFIAKQDLDSAEWGIPDSLKNALFVVDECHEFYVASRDAINPAIEQFFALCGQNGMDGVLMSQWYRRLHSSVRARVERKNVFQKLTAVGMTGKYQVGRFHTTTPDRFEKVGSDTLSYDPAIFPLYKGYADGATNTTVYKAGGQTVWRKIGKWAIFVVPAVVVAFLLFHGFFHGSGGMVKRPSPLPVSPVTGSSALAVQPQHLAQVKSAASPVSLHPAFDLKGMSPEVAYVFDLTSQARPRFVGSIVDIEGSQVGLIEWREDQGHVLDRMTTDQLRALGVLVEFHQYGLKVVWRDQAFIATEWPVDMPGTDAAANQQPSPSAPMPLQSSATPAAALSPVAPVAADAHAPSWPQRATAIVYAPPEIAPRPQDDAPAPAAKSQSAGSAM